MKYESAFLISLALSGCNGEDAAPSDFLQSELQETSTPASKKPGAKPYHGANLYAAALVSVSQMALATVHATTTARGDAVLGLRIDPAALVRHRATAAQSDLDAADRHRNVRDAFTADPTRVHDRHIVLVDDVATTAATANACAHALKAAGAHTVTTLVIARAPAPAK